MKIKTGIIVGLLILSILGVVYGAGATYSMLGGQELALVGDRAVWIPVWGKISCEQVRLECFPNADCGKAYQQIEQTGQSVFCGAAGPGNNIGIANADYFEGCDIFIEGEGWAQFSDFRKCSNSGCVSLSQNNFDYSLTNREYKQHLEEGEWLFINPNIETISVRVVAPVYGISADGGGIKPISTDYCNLASVLKADQIATFKDNPELNNLLALNEISPGRHPEIFIVGYSQRYQDIRIVNKDNHDWFVQDIGWICKIKEDTTGKLIVDQNDCVQDSSIECFPGIGNCDKDGKIVTPDQKACIPGVQISLNRVQVTSETACSQRCDTEGQIENYNCINIPTCTNGQILNSNYECVGKLEVTEKIICESKGGIWIEETSIDGTFTRQYCKEPFNLQPILILVVSLIFVIIIVSIGVKKGKK